MQGVARRLRVEFRAAPALYTVGCTVALLGAIGAIRLAEHLSHPPSTVGLDDIRVHLLAVGLVALNCLSYLVWWSRWNVIAHTQLAFSLIAYILPIYALRGLERLGGEALDAYFRVITVGLAAALAGVAVGAAVGNTWQLRRLRAVDFTLPWRQRKVSRRVFGVMALSTGAVFVAFGVMGFVPALTPDPLTAKFFRGPYAAAYEPVAPLYRAGTSAIALLLPIAALMAWRRRTVGWLVVLGGALAAMLLGLLREPALSGLLLAVGVVLAGRGRGLVRYFLLLVGAYFAGGGLYAALGALGVSAFQSVGPSSVPLLHQVAAGAPDINDQITFLRAWLSEPRYTDGRTFIGGLVPGNYPWNPSVWSLQVVNPGADITSISSGGLRLPAPIWGLVSFGWPGVIGVSFLYGAITAALAVAAKRLIPGPDTVAAACWLALYASALDVFPVFFRLSYLSVMQLVIVAAVLFFSMVEPEQRARLRLRPVAAWRL